jgi:hypothetical protein
MNRNTPQWSIRDLSAPEYAAAARDLPAIEYLLLDELEPGIFEILATFPCSANREQMKQIRDLMVVAPQMLKLIRHLREILAHNPNLDTQGMIDGENAAAIAITRMQIDQFLEEFDRGRESHDPLQRSRN